MNRLLLALLNSKTAQKLGFTAAAVGLVLYILNTIGITLAITVPIVCGVLLLLWGYNLFLKSMNKAKAAGFDKGLVNEISAPAGGKVAARKAQKELVDHWRQATSELKSAGMTLYDLPWYLLIGEPQSGKSTTLKKSGLEFPVGTEALSGAGGTRNCDWWFTNEAVILDTAGRFTFQEKNAPDSAEWKTFLRLLRDKRPRAPINGVILVIPCTSLLGDNAEERERKAVNIREKLTELQRELAIQFPVFVLITKSDQMLGFTEFFTRLPAREQKQILGWSMPGPFLQAFDPQKFNATFDSVHERVHRLGLKLLSEDISLSEVDKLFVFPEEFRALREPLHDYLKTIFMRNQYLPPLFFRGFYFTSGLQEGRPIAKACAAMLQSASAAGGEIIEDLAKAFQQSKAFFIQDFYIKKLFPEKSMIVHSRQKSALDRKIGLAALAVTALLIVATAGILGFKLRNLRAGVTSVAELARQVHTQFISGKESGGRAPLQLAADFRKKYESPEVANLYGRPDVRRALDEMHWMYFLHNLLYPQGNALLGRIQNEQRTKGADLNNLYGEYATLWGLNGDWRLHTWDRKGPFSEAADEKYGLTRVLDYPFFDATATSGTTDAFRTELEAVQKGLSTEKLDFAAQHGDYGNASVDSLPPNLPIRLDMVPGDVRPQDNEVIRRAVEEATKAQSLNESEIKAIADGLRDKIRGAQSRLSVLLGNEHCGCYHNDAETTAVWSQIQSIQEGMQEIDNAINEKRGLLESITLLDEDQNRKNLRSKLAWIEKAGGEPGKALAAYAEKRIDECVATRTANAGKAQSILRDNKELADCLDFSSSSLALRTEYTRAREGVRTLLGLIEAEWAAIHGFQRAGLRDSADVQGQLDKWSKNSGRTVADSWARQNAGAPASAAGQPRPGGGGRTPWTVAELASFVGKSVSLTDEAARVHCWVAYVDGRIPADAGEKGVSLASLSQQTLPECAKAKTVAEVIGDFRKGTGGDLKCPAHQKLVSDTIKSISARFLSFWDRAYAIWRPVAWLDEIHDWKALKQSDPIAGGKFAKQVADALSPMLDELGRFHDAVDKDLGALNAVWKDNSSGRGASSLETAASDFSGTIGDLPGERDQAWVAVYGSKADSRSRDRIRAMGAYAKFESVPRKIDQLLNPEEDFKRQLREFGLKWRGKLAGRFPFRCRETEDEPRTPANWLTPSAVPDQQQTYSLTVDQALPKDLEEFLFGENGINGILNNAYYQQEWSAKPENKPFADFMNGCVKLREFFFDKEGKPTPIDLKLTLRDMAAQMKDVVNKPTQIEFLQGDKPINGKNGSPYWRIHFRTPDLVWETPWEISSAASESEQYSMQILHEGGAASAPPTVFIIRGPFSLIAYAYTCGALSSDRKDIKRFAIMVHRPELKEYSFTFDLTFAKQGLPALPDWNAIRRWTSSE